MCELLVFTNRGARKIQRTAQTTCYAFYDEILPARFQVLGRIRGGTRELVRMLCQVLFRIDQMPPTPLLGPRVIELSLQ